MRVPGHGGGGGVLACHVPGGLGDVPSIPSENPPKSSKHRDISKAWLTTAQQCECLTAQDLWLPKCSAALKTCLKNYLHIYAVGLSEKAENKIVCRVLLLLCRKSYLRQRIKGKV